MSNWNCKQDINIIYSDKKDFSDSPQRHKHPLDELLIVERGKSKIVTPEATCQLEGAYAVLYPRGMMHYQVNDMSDGYIRWYVHYDSRAVSDLVLPGAVPTKFFAIPLTDGELSALQQYLKPLAALRRRNTVPEDIHARKLLLALILNALHPIVEGRSPDSAHQSAAGSSLVSEICMYINKNFAEPLTLEGLSRQFYISRSKLARSFRSTLDISVKDYILSVRIARAKTMLERGLSIEEVAGHCGFLNTGYFIKVFHRVTGITPAKYRKLASKSE